MSRRSVLCLLAVLAFPSLAAAQQRVEVKRMRLRLIDPQQYRVTLQLEPSTMIDLVAPADGYLRSLEHQAGATVRQEETVARMENAEAQFELERAKALQRVAEIELDLAKEKGDSRGVELAQANATAAEANAQLANLKFERTTLRSPIAGIVFETGASPGRFLRAGDLVATVGDTTKLVVELPMARSAAAEGTEIDLDVADKTVKARIERVQPLSSKYDAIRDIVVDAVSAVVVVDNSKGDFAVGQTVRTPLIPENPVCIVPNSAIGNLEGNGGRKVQVIRSNVVTDVPVQVMSGVGESTSYVSGALTEEDELITSSSIPLEDGIQVRRAGAPKPATPAGGRQPPKKRFDPDDAPS